MTPIEVTATIFGRDVDSGIVQRTFRTAFVVMFGGSSMTPLVTLKEPMSHVAPAVRIGVVRKDALITVIETSLTDSEQDQVDYPPGISRLLPDTFYVIRDQCVALNELSFPGLNVRFHSFIGIEDIGFSQ